MSSSRRTRWLLLSAYQADSHAYWAAWLPRAFPAIDWRVLTLPGRHFKWRIRGNPLSWLGEIEAASRDIDGIIATSMVDLATLRGLCPALAHVPNIYYFHENQFAYPVGPQQTPSVEPQLVQLYGALAADQIVFNSRWNAQSFLTGVDELLQRMPDAVPGGLRARLEPRIQVLPVPVEPVISPEAPPRDPRLIVWNHRWEYDKAPAFFAAAMRRLAEQGVMFRLALLGARPATPPAPLTELAEQFPSRIVANGRVDRATYEALLAQSGIAVSTALHEFQGIGMLEAVSAGAIPLVPDALVYPEQFAATYRYPPGDIEAFIERLATWLVNPPASPAIDRWLVPSVKPQWAALINRFS
ncbi:MAG: DUF3524 domain-containing protein [Spiribacter sp.]|nr:DUF3524 domain-containing protein [Spiribacter sp.]MDR9455538.1 DUF3524 domain-containing protein [Spiribacter sp.]